MRRRTLSLPSLALVAFACTPGASREVQQQSRELLGEPLGRAREVAPGSVQPSPSSDPASEKHDASPVAAAPGPETPATPEIAWPSLSERVRAERRQAQLKVLGSAAAALLGAEESAGDVDSARAGAATLPESGGHRAEAAERPHAAPETMALLADLPTRHRTPIENDQALAHFHAALARLGTSGGPERVRLLAYGASHTQADVYPGYLRAYLQGRFGNGGRGFVLLGHVNHWHRTLDSRVREHGLSLRTARTRLDTISEPLGLFGAALLGSQPHSYSEVTFGPASQNTEFEIAYYAEPGGGRFDLLLDGKQLARIDTRGTPAATAHYAFRAAPGAHVIRVELAGGGSVRLFGLIAETASTGVVVDTLGIGGARMADALRWDEPAWLDALSHRSPDLVTFAYGTNEAFDGAVRTEAYAEGLARVLTRFRQAAPSASCVLITPFDLPEPARARLPAIIAVQRRAARAFDCGVWDGDAFMGGPGSVQAWAAMKPPLATADHIHLTRLGYVAAGTALGDALLRGLDLGP
jgi:lysophospholipase L1-like esterase